MKDCDYCGRMCGGAHDEEEDASEVEEIPQMAGTLEALDKLTLKSN